MASNRFTRDHDTGAMTTIDVSHNLIHKGHHFLASSLVHSTAINWVVDLRTLTNTTEYHVTTNFTCDSAAKISMYRNPVWTITGGTLLDNINRSETHSYTSSLAIYSSPTITTTGTARMLLTRIPASSIQGNQSTGGDTGSRAEFILKTGNSYQFECVMAASSNAYVIFDWYEVQD
jgi:hypothetical protein